MLCLELVVILAVFRDIGYCWILLFTSAGGDDDHDHDDAATSIKTATFAAMQQSNPLTMHFNKVAPNSRYETINCSFPPSKCSINIAS